VELSADQWIPIDDYLFAGSCVMAIQLFCEQTGLHLRHAMDHIAERQYYLRTHFAERFPPSPDNSVEAILTRFAALPQLPTAVEALWDGDSSGWYLVILALLEQQTLPPPHYSEHQLAILQGDNGDLRLFNQQVPPWPEAQLAQQVGIVITAQYGVPFYFPSPHYPEDDCPRWWQRTLATPCERCGIPLLQDHDPCPWRGMCYQCHLAREREDRASDNQS
jgi:hypothetical protein